MPKKIKLKTHRGAAKRFKRTKRGKFLRGMAFKQQFAANRDLAPNRLRSCEIHGKET